MDKREELGKAFNTVITSVISKLVSQSTAEQETASLERLLVRLRIGVRTLGAAVLLDAASPFVVEFAEALLSPNRAKVDEFLLNFDIKAEVAARGLEVESSDMYIFDLIQSVRVRYGRSPQAERDSYYGDIKRLVALAIEYTLLR